MKGRAAGRAGNGGAAQAPAAERPAGLSADGRETETNTETDTDTDGTREPMTSTTTISDVDTDTADTADAHGTDAHATDAHAADAHAANAHAADAHAGTGDADAGSCSWDELVTAALLGTDRRPATGAPEELLGAAARQTVRRRAGLLPATAAGRPTPAPPDGRPALPDAARRRLALLLADRSAPAHAGGRRGTAPDLGELLPQWLAIANERGLRPPAALMPALLDAARARTDLRPQALAFAGPYGLWLARFNPEGASRCGARRAARPCPTPGTPAPYNSCGRKGCSPSG